MWPLVWSGAQVSLETCDLSYLEPGDVVVILTERGPVLHRVVLRDGVLCTQGDWRDTADGPIENERLLGSVRGFLLGRWTVPTPRLATRWLNRRVLALVPTLRTLNRPRFTRALRMGRDRLARSPIGRAITGNPTLLVRVLDETHAQELRRTAWRRGRYETKLHADLQRWAAGRGGFVVAALHPNGRIVGQLLLREDDPDLLSAFDHWVHPWHRGRGVGTSLIERALREATRRRHREIRVWVEDGSVAHQLWSRFDASVQEVRSRPGARALVELRVVARVYDR